MSNGMCSSRRRRDLARVENNYHWGGELKRRQSAARASTRFPPSLPSPRRKEAAKLDDSEDHDYKSDATFKDHLKKSAAQSEFSRRLTITEQRRFLPVYQVSRDPQLRHQGLPPAASAALAGRRRGLDPQGNHRSCRRAPLLTTPSVSALGS